MGFVSVSVLKMFLVSVLIENLVSSHITHGFSIDFIMFEIKVGLSRAGARSGASQLSETMLRCLSLVSK